MILGSLSAYYDRIADGAGSSIPPPGFSSEKAHFALVLSMSGKLVQVLDLRESSGKGLLPQRLNVPQGTKKSVNIAANFLWGSTSYVLGADDKGNHKRSADCHFAFKALHTELLADCTDQGAQAVLKFLAAWSPDRATTLPEWRDMLKGNLVFQIDGERTFVHERSPLRKVWLAQISRDSDGETGICLVSGECMPIARLHPAIKGIRGAQSSGAALVSFNLDAFCSYGKEQNFNAPVSEVKAAAYTKALNYLLASDRHRIQIGDATTVFWTERDSPIESVFGLVLNPIDASAGDDRQLQVLLEAISHGKLPAEYDPNIRFYILGLSPNAARLSLRFWYVSRVKDICEKLGQHFRDLAMVKAFESDPAYPGMWRLLQETINKKANDPPSPLLGGAIMQSILNGTMYPRAVLSAVIGRIRADQNISYLRAAIIKAVLARKYRILNQSMEVPVALDNSNKTPAYLLGRLFAVLEKAQQDAIPGANTTIKDKFYGSASATPRVVFPQLLRLAQHHIQKAEYGNARDRQIEEIICDLREFPAHLGLDEQGVFAIGYYHQRQGMFKKSEKTNDQKRES